MKAGRMSITQIWVILVVLTLLSVSIGEKHAAGAASSCVVVLIAAVKARWIILDYMEARHAPPPWRWMFEGWLAACTALMLALAVVV
jgi:hypothetical protein